MRRTHLLLLTAALAAPRLIAAQSTLPVMPAPADVSLGEGRLLLDSTFTVSLAGFANHRLEGGIARVLARLEGRIAQPLARTPAPSGGRLVVEVGGAGEAVQSPAEDESYTLVVQAGGAQLSAPTVVGALRGLETLLQLVTADSAGFSLQAVTVRDRPRFPWRGLLVDAGRHFMPVDVIKRTLDGMAVVKLNVLHWHLSEDQGFRVESRRFPRLHELGSDGLYYTQAQIREIVAYARDRGIRVVPEFDMPGHSTSWFVGYPQYASAPGPYAIERRFGVFEPAFDPTREETYHFIENFVEEMSGLFPDPYWHIGGDEVNPAQWNTNPAIVAYRKAKGLKDNEALQTHFNQRLSRILTRHGKRMIGWDEILHRGLPQTTVVQSWRGAEYLGRATSQGYGSILSAPFYLDHMDPADQHYFADPLPATSTLTPAQAALVLGGEACMWAEHVSMETVESRLWPRLAAVAERLWSPREVRDVEDMYRRLSLVSLQLERDGIRHEGHTARMLRALTGQRDVATLEALLDVTMPVTFGQRGRLQQTTQLTPLTRLVDAARPDPWLRARLNALAIRATLDTAAAPRARAELKSIFEGWRPLAAEVTAMTVAAPLAEDGVPAAEALGRLAATGIDALAYLEHGSAPNGWKDGARATLQELAKPQGLLRLAGVEAVTTLTEAVP